MVKTFEKEKTADGKVDTNSRLAHIIIKQGQNIDWFTDGHIPTSSLTAQALPLVIQPAFRQSDLMYPPFKSRISSKCRLVSSDIPRM